MESHSTLNDFEHRKIFHLISEPPEVIISNIWKYWCAIFFALLLYASSVLLLFLLVILLEEANELFSLQLKSSAGGAVLFLTLLFGVMMIYICSRVWLYLCIKSGFLDEFSSIRLLTLRLPTNRLEAIRLKVSKIIVLSFCISLIGVGVFVGEVFARILIFLLSFWLIWMIFIKQKAQAFIPFGQKNLNSSRAIWVFNQLPNWHQKRLLEIPIDL